MRKQVEEILRRMLVGASIRSLNSIDFDNVVEAHAKEICSLFESPETSIEYCELEDSDNHGYPYGMWCVTHDKLADHCGPDGDSMVCSEFVAKHSCNCHAS